jgi:hypothetical protein
MLNWKMERKEKANVAYFKILLDICLRELRKIYLNP